MSTYFQRGMAEVTRLTRTGKLQEATAMIRSLLHRPDADAHPHADRSAPPQIAAGDVIEGAFTEVVAPSDPAPSQSATSQSAPSKPASPKRAAASKKAAAADPSPSRRGIVRSPLSETLRKIAAGGMPARAPLTDVQAPVAEGAQFLALMHGGPQGRRSYRLYIPAARPAAGQMPLVVMLHGCTQTPEDFAIGTGMNLLAEEFGCMIAYPAQPMGANAQKCWNWFRPEDQRRDQGEPALIAGMTQEILRTYAADPARTYVAGLSAGGAAAVIVAAAYPEIFAAVGVHSGLPSGAARDVGSAFGAMRSGAEGVPHTAALPTIAFHGLADTTVHPSNGTAILAQALPALPRLRLNARKDRVPGGQAYSVTAHHHPDGRTMAEHWQIDGAGHAWAGGRTGGSYTDPKGPDASREMLRFFLQHSLT